MGLVNSREDHWEQPSEKHEATLYYFGGRGLADQIRWMMAASEVNFTQKLISQRDQLLRMSDAQLPFGQLPLLQIDGLELVQSQAIVRYLARRAGLQGLTADEEVKCDMIAEAVRDLVSLVTAAPFQRKYYIPPPAIEDLHIPPVPPTNASAYANNSPKPASTASTSASTSTASKPPAAIDISTHAQTQQAVVLASAANKPAQTVITPTSATSNPATPKTHVDGAHSMTVLPPAPYDNALQHDPLDYNWQEHLKLMKSKWRFIGQRFEAILRSNKMQLLAQQRRQQAASASGNQNSTNTTVKAPVGRPLPAASLNALTNGETNSTAVVVSRPTSTAIVPTTALTNSASSNGQQVQSASPTPLASTSNSSFTTNNLHDTIYFMVGAQLTYADILVAHITTWYVEECGPEIVADMPMLVALQNAVISLPGIRKFIKSIHYFPLGDRLFCEQVSRVLGRKIN